MPDSQEPQLQQSSVVQLPPPQPISGQPSGLRPKRRLKRLLLWIGASLFAGLLLAIAGASFWYNTQLSPLGDDTQQLIVVNVEPGMNPSQIGQLLHDKGIIRSTLAFEIHARVAGIRGKLQAGTYRLSPAESTPQIAEHLVNGKVDQFSITFLPGGTLADHRKVLQTAGFTDKQIAEGLSAQFNASVLLASKPSTVDLEGYIYGETYAFGSGATVQMIVQRALDELTSVVQENDLVAAFASRGLNLHQGLTLASIVQREVAAPTGTNQPTADQTQVAQIFYSRLAIGMTLGSDVTYQYAADKDGVPRSTNLDSPYNTRRYPGLPPGPIASPGLTSLLAVASPASGDYLYFLSGDDDVTYFGRTTSEHEANIRNHCAVKCSTL